MASIIPSTMIMLPLYDILSNSNAQSSTGQEGNTTGSLIAKYISPRFLTGLITMQLLYPLDTIKRCMMVHGSRGYSSLDGGFFGTLRSINKANGIRGFYKGITIASIKMAPSIYIQLALYDWLKNQSLLKEKEPSLDIIEHTLKISQGEREKVEAQ